MGGADKALLMLAGRPLLAHGIARLSGQVEQLALSANGDAARFARYGLPVLPDPPDLLGQGPLAGILAGLDWAAGQGARALVTVSVDTPFVPFDLVDRLDAATRGGPAMAAYGERLHPTAALWPTAQRAALAKDLAAGERRLRAALSGAVVVAFEDVIEDPFININTIEDLARAEALCAPKIP